MHQQQRVRQVPVAQARHRFRGAGQLSCADPKALQRICDGLDDKKIAIR
jgi:hypothetical protein